MWSLTTHPVANAMRPVTSVKMARLSCNGCRSPSLLSVRRGPRARVLVASGMTATLP